MSIEELLTKQRIKDLLGSKSDDRIEFRIVTEQTRYPLKNVKEIFQSSDYKLDPYYQRDIVWGESTKSRLIESFIINIPIPPIFLFEYEYGKFEIMDGKQRISTIISFLDDGFCLESLEFFQEYNGKKYSELPADVKETITRRYISGIIILSESTKDESEKQNMRRLVFERLNTGGLALNRQEVRNAIYSGPFNDMLKRLASDELFEELWAPPKRTKYNSRLEYTEKVLRFFAYFSAVRNDITSISTSRLLDLYMEASKEFTDPELKELEEFFKKVVLTVKRLFGEKAFMSSQKSKKAENMIFDSVMLFTSYNLDNLEQFDDGAFEQLKFEVLKNNKADFNGKYTAINNVKTRVSIFKEEFLKDG